MLADFSLDRYALQSRLRPALLTLFPILITAAVWAPPAYMLGLVGLVAASGAIVVFVLIARTRGRAVQEHLVGEWGGFPTTLWLRHTDSNLDDSTTQRCHRFLEKHMETSKYSDF